MGELLFQEPENVIKVRLTARRLKVRSYRSFAAQSSELVRRFPYNTLSVPRMTVLTPVPVKNFCAALR